MLNRSIFAWIVSALCFGCAASSVDPGGGGSPGLGGFASGGAAGDGIAGTAGDGTGGTAGDGTGGVAGARMEERVLNFGEFVSFAVSHGPALGYCPPDSQLATASVTKIDENEYTLEYSTVESRGGSLDPEACISCSPPFLCEPNGASCWEFIPGPPARPLSGEEITRLKETFSSVVELGYLDPECGLLDPCLVVALSWDSYEGSDYPCEAPRIAESTSYAILEVLGEITGLAPDP